MDRNRHPPKGESAFWAIVVLLACFFLVSLSALFAAPPYQVDATQQYQQRIRMYSASKVNVTTTTFYDIATLVGAADIPRGSKSYSFYNAGSTECWVSLAESVATTTLTLYMGQGTTNRDGEDRWRLVRNGQTYNVAFTSQRIGIAPAQGSTCDFDHDLRW